MAWGWGGWPVMSGVPGEELVLAESLLSLTTEVSQAQGLHAQPLCRAGAGNLHLGTVGELEGTGCLVVPDVEVAGATGPSGPWVRDTGGLDTCVGNRQGPAVK